MKRAEHFIPERWARSVFGIIRDSNSVLSNITENTFHTSRHIILQPPHVTTIGDTRGRNLFMNVRRIKTA
jgi:hypothetical protein